MYIYKTTCLINSKVYIGMSTKDDENYLGSGSVIKSAIKKYGKKNFKRDILEYCDTFEKLCEREIYWVEYYKNLLKEDCYNVSSGGKGGNWKMWMSEDRINEVLSNFKKASDLKKGKYSSWNKGIKYSEDMIEKLSRAHKGKKQSKQTVEKRVSKLIGKKRNEEQKQNLSKSLKAVYSNGFSKEHKMKLSQSRKGAIMPEETKQKLKKEKVKVECPYCKKIGGYPVMKRYHFENCKLSKQCTE